MQSRIYRFEIVRAVVNGVFEAHDTTSNAGVMLYEWTPAVGDREGAKLRLSEVMEQVRGEVFSADASLYLSVPSVEAAEEALRALHSHGLFVGIRAGGPVAAPPPLPPVQPPPPPRQEVQPPPPPPSPPPPVVVKAKSSGRTVWLAVLAVIICSILAFALGSSVGESTASDAAARKNSETSSQALQDLSTAQSQNSDLQTKLTTLQGELKNLDGIHFLRMTNKTASMVHIAVMYKNWAGVWTLEGWQMIASNATTLVATSPNNLFYYSAYSDALVWQGSNDADAYHITRNNFVYFPDLQTAPTDWETMKLVKVDGGNLDLIETK